MIIIKLWGGMCNQMFQYAFGYALSKVHNDQLAFDIDFYKNQPKHVGKRLPIRHSDFSISKMDYYPRPYFAKLLENKYLNHLIRYHKGCSCSFSRKYHFFIEQYHKYYDIIPFYKNYINYYDGYWQTSKYFEQFREDILKEFTPNATIKDKIDKWRKGINSNNCVALHIRRGDYLNTINQKSLKGGNVIGDLNYYKKAMDYMMSNIDNPTFCFFSDDIEWCKDNFLGRYANTVFVENKGMDAAIIDLFSIAKCEHGIMSPSSFSWWGNWLRANNKDSIVICPQGDIGNEEFVCNDWITL